MRVADLILEALVTRGVTIFFGIPGGTIAPLYDAICSWQASGKLPHVHLINCRHETGAVFAASGYQRTSGQLAAVLTTSGPGLTNALTGIASAWEDRTPVLVLTGEVPRTRTARGALQDGSAQGLDVLGMARSVTVLSEQASQPGSAAQVVDNAINAATTGRKGPALVTLPLDVLSAQAAPWRPCVRGVDWSGPDPLSVETAAYLLSVAKRPLIFAGSGVSLAAGDVLKKFAVTYGIPVMTTPKAKGKFPEDSPLSLGVFGYGGHPSAKNYLELGCDVLLCLGCGLGEVSTNAWSPLLKPSCALIQVDTDPTQMGKNYAVDVALVSDAYTALVAIGAKMHPIKHESHLTGIKVEAPAPSQTSRSLHPARVVSLLQAQSPEQTIITSDIGEHLLFALHYLKMTRPNFISCLGLGSMGSGIGAAIGAKAADNTRPVLAICGDFGFQMYGSELATCVEEGLGVVFAVFNDARMRMVESGNQRVFGRSTPMHVKKRVSFAALAQAVGAEGIEIHDESSLMDLPDDLWTRPTPTVLDVHIDPTAAFGSNGRSEQFSHFNVPGYSAHDARLKNIQNKPEKT